MCVCPDCIAGGISIPPLALGSLGETNVPAGGAAAAASSHRGGGGVSPAGQWGRHRRSTPAADGSETARRRAPLVLPGGSAVFMDENDI